MVLKDAWLGLANPLHFIEIEGPFGIISRKTCGTQQVVARPQRHVESLGDDEYHLAAGVRPARLDEAQVPLRDPRIQGEIQLALAAKSPPLLQRGTKFLLPEPHPTISDRLVRSRVQAHQTRTRELDAVVLCERI